MGNSTLRPSAAKSPKRSKSRFTLWLHTGTGQWTKKIKGKMYYFGRDKDIALAEYLRRKEGIEAGRQSTPKTDDVLTLKELTKLFLTHKKSQVEIGELTERSFRDYLSTCEKLSEDVLARGLRNAAADRKSLSTEDVADWWHRYTNNASPPNDPTGPVASATRNCLALACSRQSERVK